MENKEYRDIYEAMCRKAALNAQRIGTDLREFPGRMDGRYLMWIAIRCAQWNISFAGHPAFLPEWR